MILDWHPGAEAEFLDAAKYYGQQDGGLGNRFALLVEATAERLLLNPQMRRCFYRECRRVKAEKFPYLIIYRLKGELLQIVAVMHTSRRPGYWKDRI
jgi:toxin ParE1/3/4